MNLRRDGKQDYSGETLRVVRTVRTCVTLLVAAALWTSCSRESESKTAPAANNTQKPATAQSQSGTQPAPKPEAPTPAVAPRPAASSTAAAPQTPRPEPTPQTRQLVSALSQLDVKHGPLTPEQAAAWKQALQQLKEQGPAAVAAIREFLEKNLDLSFDADGNSKLTGAATLRLALLSALSDIGGPDAIAALEQTVQTTADPAELATLAKLLNQAEPDKHREELVAAARDTLALAASGQWDGRDVSPLFEVLKNYGGASGAAELERYANTWFDYTPLTLAQMPDGAGIPSLVKLAINADGSVTLGREIYQRVLAQVAADYPTAADALIELARANRIDVSAWPALAASLEGNTLQLAAPLLDPASPLAARPDTRTYHVSVGNQNFLEVAPPDNMTANQIGDRIRLIDRLLQSTTSPAAIDALEKARVALSARLQSAK